VNECLSGSHSCIQDQMCVNTDGSFRCQRASSCGPGYQTTARSDCHDIDECVLGSHNCGPEFLCTNTAGSFRCHPRETCGTGFVQDAAGSCIDINECVVNSSPCPRGQTCVNALGSYTCRQNTVACGRGYHLNQDGMRCLVWSDTESDVAMPTEIVFLRTTTPASSTPPLPPPAAAAAADVDFEIMVADEESSFDVVKRSQHNMVVGVVRQVKPLVGPRAVALEVGMNYVRMGVVSHRNIVVIHVFVSEFWF
ncbi:hypothetical protein CRUP_005525, partial [Coryphaenoides rupestris]